MRCVAKIESRRGGGAGRTAAISFAYSERSLRWKRDAEPKNVLALQMVFFGERVCHLSVAIRAQRARRRHAERREMTQRGHTVSCLIHSSELQQRPMRSSA